MTRDPDCKPGSFFANHLTANLFVNSTNLKLCIATATHNFKWVKITDMCLIWDQPFANIDV